MNASPSHAVPGAPHAASTQSVDSSSVLSALNDEGCRRILAACDEKALTARECADQCDFPLSTVYRKLDLLTEASLLDEGRRIDLGNNHPREFSTSFDTLSVSLAHGDGITVDFLQVAADGGLTEGESTSGEAPDGGHDEEEAH